MKQRTIPFGYQYEMGKPISHPEESLIVQKVFIGYMAGESLKMISEKLTAAQIEYLPGQCNWNKARVNRLLENRKYIGADGFPRLVEDRLFDQVQRNKKKACTNQTPYDEEMDTLRPYLLCDSCGAKVTRHTDKRLEISVAWKCPSGDHSIRIEDKTLKAEVLELMNELIADPLLARLPEEQQTEVVSLETRRMEQDFHRALDSAEFDEEGLINMILEFAAKTYESITSSRHISDRLTADFANAEPLSSLDKELFSRTVKYIRLDPNGKVKLELQNGRIIERSDEK